MKKEDLLKANILNGKIEDIAEILNGILIDQLKNQPKIEVKIYLAKNGTSFSCRDTITRIYKSFEPLITEKFVEALKDELEHLETQFKNL